jgi:hypothetical protein
MRVPDYTLSETLGENGFPPVFPNTGAWRADLDLPIPIDERWTLPNPRISMALPIHETQTLPKQ